MGKITLAQAEKAAERYLNSKMEQKVQKDEEAAALKVLRQYCQENEGVETIGPVLAYTKKFAPKLKGAKAALESVAKKLRKVYVNLRSDFKAIDQDPELLAELKKKGYTLLDPDAELIAESLHKDEKLAKLLEDNGVEVEAKEEYYFKHVG